MKYKVGDKVRIKSLDWYNENKGNADKTNSVWSWFFYHMSQHCGKVMTIKNVWANSYTLEGSDSRWTDEMIEGLVEDETKPKDMGEELRKCMSDFKYWVDNYIILPDGHVFKDENGNLIYANKIIWEKKKKELPKTVNKCLEILNIPNSALYIEQPARFNYKFDLLCKLQTLLICRDAYWKIAGEEMGLGKPWKPDWTTNDKTKFCIGVAENEIIKLYIGIARYTLAFPTLEMRNAFFENFKELIEECKELL